MLFVAFISLIGSYLLFKKATLPSSQGDVFVVGTVGNYAPFVSVNAQGDYEGFDIDVANALAQQMGKTLVLKDLGSMAPLFIALEQGSIDAIIWGLSITKARLEKVAMVRYQGDDVNAYSLLFWKEIPQGITSIADMNGMTICVEPASSQEAVLNTYPNITKLSTERVDDALLMIQYGKAQAALVEPAIAAKFKNRFPETKILEVPLAEEFQVMGTGIAIKKENKKLIQQITDAIAQLQNQGMLRAFELKWGISCKV